MRKTKCFKPTSVPRYLPGSVRNCIWKDDLKEFNRHRFQVFYAEAVVDSSPPKMNPHNYLNVTRLLNDARRLDEIDRENKQLLRRINYIHRTKGFVDTFNKHAFKTTTQWPQKIKRARDIQRCNEEFYKLLVNTEAIYQKKVFDNQWKYNVEAMQHMAKYPLQMFSIKTQDRLLMEQRSISDGLELNKVRDRPLCFMDFRIKNGIRLGKVVFELYRDIAPTTVENFLTLCGGNCGFTYKGSLVYNVISGKYCELGDLAKNVDKNKSFDCTNTFKIENYELKHTKAGVLSTVPCDKKNNTSKFCITFSAQPQLDGKRVVFGKTIKGIKTIGFIQDMARRIGPPSNPIYVEDCGEYKK